MKKNNEHQNTPIGLLKTSILHQSENQYSNDPHDAFKIYKNQIVIHKSYYKIVRKNTENEKCLKNLEKRIYNGYLSDNTKRYLKRVLSAWHEATYYGSALNDICNIGKSRKLTFVTLTLSAPQSHTDNYIKRHMLNQFIIKIYRETNVKFYFWRAEKQKNGNIHFHMILDAFCNHRQIREIWNTIQKNNGYIQRFAKIHKHENPNSTDVKLIDNDHKAQLYITKYLQKDLEGQKVNGRLWGMSDRLRAIDIYTHYPDNSIKQIIKELQQKQTTEIIHNEHFTIVKYDEMSYHTIVKRYIGQEIRHYYTQMYDYLYNDQPHPLELEGVDHMQINGYLSTPDDRYTNVIDSPPPADQQLCLCL